MTGKIPDKETLTCEFKSDLRCLPDRELIEAVVCMANGPGGDIFLGVENDGRITGLHTNHQQLEGLTALIANRTQPTLQVSVTKIHTEELAVAKIAVPACGMPVATSDGVLKRRRLQANGEPECVPFLPHEFATRQANFGLIDNSALPLANATLSDFNPIERQRIRQFIDRYNGDLALLELDDEQLDRALGLTTPATNGYQPTLTGLLLIGHEEALRRLLPAHEIAHRDYHALGAAHIRLQGDELIISNPGGFVEGVGLDNLLTTEPRPRNPALADALKRIGIVERTGRGVDLIYRGLLRFGRHVPDYSQSTPHSVVLRLSLADANEQFLNLVLEEENRLGGRMPIDSLIILDGLQEARRLSLEQIAHVIQKDQSRVKSSVESLIEAGLLKGHGSGRGRSYTLSARLYDLHGKRIEYTRQAGFDRLQSEQLVKNFVTQHGKITRKDVIALCHMTPDQAYKLLKKLAEDKVVIKQGHRKSTYYISMSE